MSIDLIINSAELRKKVFITGATGFVGSAIVDELLRRDYHVRALVRDKPIERDGVQSIRGDLFDNAVLDSGMAGCSVVIHLVGIIREDPAKGQTFERIHYEGARQVIDAAKRNNIRRFIHMSALGVRADSESEYFRTKALAEQYLRNAGLDFTIMRPAMIVGPHGEFAKMLADWAFGRTFPYLFMPYFGHGFFGQRASLVQPISVRDVAAAFVNCLDRPETIGRTIELAGPERFTWDQMYATASRNLRGKRKASLGIPIWYAKLLTSMLPRSLLPFNRSQVIMASEDNIADQGNAKSLIDRPLTAFPDALGECAPTTRDQRS